MLRFLFPRKSIFRLAITYDDRFVEKTDTTVIIKCNDFIKDSEKIKKTMLKINNNDVIQSEFNQNIKITKELCIEAYNDFYKYCDNPNMFDKIYFIDKSMNEIFILDKNKDNQTSQTSQKLCIDIVALNL